MSESLNPLTHPVGKLGAIFMAGAVAGLLGPLGSKTFAAQEVPGVTLRVVMVTDGDRFDYTWQFRSASEYVEVARYGGIPMPPEVDDEPRAP
jgi:hypothetical protein